MVAIRRPRCNCKRNGNLDLVGIPFAEKNCIKSGVGPSGLYKLNLDTVFDDSVIDEVFGDQQDDWFWLFGQDKHDKRGNDTAN